MLWKHDRWKRQVCGTRVCGPTQFVEHIVYVLAVGKKRIVLRRFVVIERVSETRALFVTCIVAYAQGVYI
eukprot:11181787-Lingulodinium_polyedra.AAC.1